MPVDHYENFPVASWLLPARMRPAIEAIYAFARGADDIADEGDASDAERLRGLERYREALDRIEAGGRSSEDPFARLADTVQQYALPVALLRDLIDAFEQDVRRKRYATYADLLDYSRRSANPIGRLVLHVMGAQARPTGTGGHGDARRWSDAGSLGCSDAICSALQFINFWQDVAIDWSKGRVYLPEEDMARFGVSEAHIAEQRADEQWRALMAFECGRARALLLSGAPLARALPGRLGLEIRATVQGGAMIADRIEACAGDVFRHRPVLRKRDWAKILAKAAFA